MSLSQALATAVTGLHAAQVGLTIVADNVANAETPGYLRKTPVVRAISTGGVHVDAINRQLDQYIQRQLRAESSGAGYADLRAQFYSRLQSIYGVPGSASALETMLSDFTSALQTLSTSPDSTAARGAVLNAAQALTQGLRSSTVAIQGLRSDAEQGLSDTVKRANEAMQRIAEINRQIGVSHDASTAALEDQRDRYIDELSQLMDITVVPGANNQVAVYTGSGIQLAGTTASVLSFDGRSSLDAMSHWDSDPTKRSVGTLVLTGANGNSVDLIADRSIRSGQIAAYLEMRDHTLVQAQAQLDEIAAGLARSLSDQNVSSTAVSFPPQAGFDLDITGLLAGNSISVNYTDRSTGAQHALTFIRVDDPAALPLSNDATLAENDKVVGIDFSGGMASIISQINAALGASGLQASNPSGNTLRILDDGSANHADLNSLSATRTINSLTGGTPELPFFLDANQPYSGAITSGGPQSLGLAGRLVVNTSLIADPSRLVVYQTSPQTPAGDATRPNFILDRISNAQLSFSPDAGIGTTAAPFTGSLPAYLRQMISQQGEAADSASRLKEGQDVVFNSLKARFNDVSAVNIDVEMANLLNLQNAYAANARVASTVKEMLDALMRI
jgi:flagellar hook-associated protein 1 FlgK